MKYTTIATSLLLLITLCAFQCKKNDYAGDVIYTAELKMINTCAKFYACVIIEGDIDPDLVDNNWEHEGKVYQKAFTVENRCSFSANFKPGKNFRFRILKKAAANNCEVCAIGILGAPSKNLSIKVIP